MIRVPRLPVYLLAAAGTLPAHAATLPDPALADALRGGKAQRVIVLFRDPAEARAAGVRRDLRDRLKTTVLARLPVSKFELRRRYAELPMAALTLRHGDALDALLADPDVEAVFTDRPLQMHLTQSLPLVGQPPVVDVMARQGAGTTIAVLDTGVDYTRPELGSCTAPGVPAGCRVVATLEAAPNDAALDANGHGTLVSLTAAATAPAAKLAVVDVFDGSTAYSSDVIEGINWAIANRASYNIVALNMSLGDGVQHAGACTNPGLDPFVTPVRNARNAGIVVVASSGNDGFTSGIASPACVSEALGVGAVYDANVGQVQWSGCTDSTSAADKVTCFSNSGAPLDLLAPGALITVGSSTVGGTSFSAPMTAGAVAVLKGAFPSEAPAQTEARLANTGVSVTDSRNGLAKPRLNLLAAQGAPANDAFAAAIALSGNGGSDDGWNFNATAQSGEPQHAGASGGRSVWWQWTASSDGTLTVDTEGSAIDTLLAIYQGSTVSALTAVGSDDDGGSGTASAVTITVQSGQTYRIALDGKGGAQGALALNYSYAPPPPAADLSMSLDSAPEPVSLGATVTLTATVANTGPDGAEGVTLELTLPAALGNVSAPANCGVAASIVTCDLGSIASAGNDVVMVQATALAAGSVQSSASVSSTTADPVPANNAAAAVTTVQSTGGGGGEDGDVPLPGWALAALGASLLGALRGRRSKGF